MLTVGVLNWASDNFSFDKFSDSSHLSTMDESTEQINARQFQNDVVIPCRPTSPDIQVSLLANNGSEVSINYIK